MAVLKTNGASIKVHNGTSFVATTTTESFSLSIDQTLINYKTLDSAWQVTLAGQKSASGSVTFLYDPDNSTDQSYILADLFSANIGTQIQLQVNLTDSTPTTLTFYAVPNSMSTSIETDNVVRATVNFTVNGAVTKA